MRSPAKLSPNKSLKSTRIKPTTHEPRSPVMKPLWAGILGALEGGGIAAFISGILIGILGWRLDSTPKIGAFVSVVVTSAILGSFIGLRLAQRRTMHLVAQAKLP
jgi:hypothetical protein